MFQMLGKTTGIMGLMIVHIVLTTMLAVVVVGTGEWSEDAEDLGKFLFLFFGLNADEWMRSWSIKIFMFYISYQLYDVT